MIWSCRGESLPRRKDESGAILRRCWVRRYEESCRLDAALRERRHDVLPERRSITGLLINLESMVSVLEVWNCGIVELWIDSRLKLFTAASSNIPSRPIFWRLGVRRPSRTPFCSQVQSRARHQHGKTVGQAAACSS